MHLAFTVLFYPGQLDPRLRYNHAAARLNHHSPVRAMHVHSSNPPLVLLPHDMLNVLGVPPPPPPLRNTRQDIISLQCAD